ncbi:hypothetical protein C8J56DRAFT_1026011 [Mycena floridula]|nr:hypothetical protein C8J56DRAFT_1026011 [Mycena floridula]
MTLPLIFLFFGLSSTRVEAFQLRLLSNPVALGAGADFQWDAVDTDPDQFTMEVVLDTMAQFPFSNVTRARRLQGGGTSSVLHIVGPHTMQAIESNTGEIIAQIHFQVSEPSTAVETTSKQSSTSSLITSHSTDITHVQGPGTSNTVHEAISITSSFTSSITSSNPSVLNTASSIVSPHHNTTPIMAGTVSAVILIVALIIGGLFIRRRRQRLRNMTAIPYETSMADTARVFVTRKKTGLRENRRSGPQLASEKQASPEPVVLDGEPTERQRFLQNRAEEINKQLTESENVLTNVADPPPDLMGVLMAENIRQNAEIQRLRDLISSDWALGLMDNPPPYYPHSEAASE